MTMYDNEYCLEIVLDDDLFPVEDPEDPAKQNLTDKGEIKND